MLFVAHHRATYLQGNFEDVVADFVLISGRGRGELLLLGGWRVSL
jgi:hypothetical protein